MIILAVLLICGGGFLLVRQLHEDFRKRFHSYEADYIAEATEKLDALYAFVTPQQLWSVSVWTSLLAACIGFLALVRASFLCAGMLAAVFGCVGAALPRVVVRILLHRRNKNLLMQLADAISMMGNNVKAGLGIQQAFDQVANEMPAPISQEFRIIVRDRQLGRSLEESVERFAARVPLVEVRMFAMVVKLSQRVGGNISDAMGRVATTIRNRMMIEEKVLTLTSETRMQSLVLAVMPFGLGGIMLLLSPDIMRPFLFSRIGLVAVLAVVVLELLGGYTIWRIMRIKY